MIHSMTGYAAVSTELPHGAIHLELKSVNSRYLDTQFRIAEELRSIEPALRELILARISRGKLDCRLSYSPAQGDQSSHALNGNLLRRLIELDASVRAVGNASRPLSVAEILAWPGMLDNQTPQADLLREHCLALMQRGLDELAATRAREGNKLRQMIVERVERMEELVAKVVPILPQILAAYQERLATRLREAIGNGDEDRIRQEVALFGTKIDVAEELTRLQTHLQEVVRILEKGGQVGKRLDFMMQELNRESNTLGSKSVSSEVSASAMELKLLVEQMREQIQNIE